MAMRRVSVLAATGSMVLLIAASAGVVARPATVDLDAGHNRADWPLKGKGLSGAYFSPLGDISAANVSKLGFAFEFDDFVVRGRTHHGLESNPIMVDGTLYFSGPWGVAYAIDARTGAHKWTFDPQPDGEYARNACCDVVNRGVAVAEGKVFVGALDGHLFALDAKTGKPLWKTDTFYDRKWNYTITGAPFVAGDKVLIGNAGADMGSRGYVSAYDIATGKLAWRFWAVPGEEPDETPEVAMARKTWPADTRWELGMGGNAWDGLAFDPETNTAFLALGNGGPHPAWLRSKSGKVGDELFLSSIVAVDAATGRMKWYYQTTPGDSWDFAATSPFVLAELNMGGKLRKVLMQAPKNGIFYVLDRDTGELLRADPYTRVNWTSGIDRKTGRPKITPAADYRNGTSIIFPGATGGHAWQPMAFSPRTGLVYLPVYATGMRYEAEARTKFRPGSINQAMVGEFPPFDRPRDRAQLAGSAPPTFESRLKAWDPVTGKPAWISERMVFITGGTLVAGDLVFQGATDGYLRAFDARTGRKLLELFVGTAIMAAPIAYKLDGVQYVAVLAGAGGPQGAGFAPDVVAAKRENYERLLVFRLGGSKMPLPPLRTPQPRQPTPPPISASAATLEHGRILFEQNCHRCHMMGGATGIYPNLWNISPDTLAAFQEIVHQGAFRYAGMGAFADVLTPADVNAIKAFLVNDIIVKRRDGPKAGAQYRVRTH